MKHYTPDRWLFLILNVVFWGILIGATVWFMIAWRGAY